MKKLVFASVLFFSLFISGCTKERTINLNSEDLRCITPDQQWAVIKVPYAAFLESCDYSSAVKHHARTGDIFLVKGKEYVKKQQEENESRRNRKKIAEFELWYKFEEGCLDSSLVDIYDTKLKAQTAASRITSTK
ncbi:MAG: hypothetical protein SPJ89_06225 [Treponema sp.]|nr:hypothetical protein [Spirochaetia bacterium]MDD7458773.1 hypothetical protein [Spirochaetales bacterium]MDY5811557.1 hypothetical protein [Treponema sp.]